MATLELWQWGGIDQNGFALLNRPDGSTIKAIIKGNAERSINDVVPVIRGESGLNVVKLPFIDRDNQTTSIVKPFVMLVYSILELNKISFYEFKNNKSTKVYELQPLGPFSDFDSDACPNTPKPFNTVFEYTNNTSNNLIFSGFYSGQITFSEGILSSSGTGSFVVEIFDLNNVRIRAVEVDSADIAGGIPFYSGIFEKIGLLNRTIPPGGKVVFGHRVAFSSCSGLDSGATIQGSVNFSVAIYEVYLSAAGRIPITIIKTPSTFFYKVGNTEQNLTAPTLPTIANGDWRTGLLNYGFGGSNQTTTCAEVYSNQIDVNLSKGKRYVIDLGQFIVLPDESGIELQEYLRTVDTPVEVELLSQPYEDVEGVCTVGDATLKDIRILSPGVGDKIESIIYIP